MEATLKFTFVICVALAASTWLTSTASALDRPSIAAVAAAPKSFLGKRIGFKAAPCVSDPKGGFVCLITAAGRTLRVDAGALGASGGDEVGERLIGPCKGRDKLRSSACRFDVEIEPTSAQTEAVMLEFEGERVTRLYSGAVEMRITDMGARR